MDIEGIPNDKGIKLTEDTNEFHEISKEYFEEVLLFNTRKLLKFNPEWYKILINQKILKEHLNSKQLGVDKLIK